MSAEDVDREAKRLRRESFGPHGDPHKKYLYYCPQMKDLAKAIAAQPSHLDIQTREISWKKFPDGFPNLTTPIRPVQI